MTLATRMPRWVLLSLRIIVSAIFIYAGITKATAPIRFATDIDNFHLLPWIMTVPLAFYLPWLEVACGVALLLLRLDRGALLTLVVLTAVFLGAVTSARVRGIDISCGCFGHATRDFSFTSHLFLDLGIMTAALLLWSRPRVHART